MARPLLGLAGEGGEGGGGGEAPEREDVCSSDLYRRSVSSRRASPLTPSSRKSCLWLAVFLGWRAMWRRMAASESIKGRSQVLGLRCQGGGRARTPVSPSLFQILLLNNSSMMQFVSGDDIGQGTHGDLVLVGHAAAGPGGFVEIAKQRDGGSSDSDVVLDQVGQRTAREGGVADVVVLLEAFDRSRVTTRNAQGAVAHDALGIVDVAKHFLQAPLIRRVAEIAVGLGASGEQENHLAALVLERGENVVAQDQGDVVLVVGRVFSGLGPEGVGRGWSRLS